jgi:hypothetical protein
MLQKVSRVNKAVSRSPPNVVEELVGRCWKTTSAVTVVQPLQGTIPRSFPSNLQLDRSILGTLSASVQDFQSYTIFCRRKVTYSFILSYMQLLELDKLYTF